MIDLQKLRKERNIGIEALAKLMRKHGIAVSPSKLRTIERGESPWEWEKFETLLSVLGYDIKLEPNGNKITAKDRTAHLQKRGAYGLRVQ